MNPTPPQRIFSFEFIGLCLLIFLAYCNISVFFSLYVYFENLGVPQSWRGVLIGASALATMAAYLVVSPFLNTRNAAKAAALGIVILLGCGGAYLVAVSTPALLAVRLANGLGVALVSAGAMTLLVAVIPPTRSGQAFGLYSIAMLLPYSVMPPLFDWLSPAYLDYPQGYALVALALAPALLVLAVLGRRSRGKSHAHAPRPTLAAMAKNARKRPVSQLLVVNAMYYLSFASLFFLAKSLFLARGLAGVGLFFSIQTGCMLLLRVFANRLFDVVPKLRLIRFCYAVTGATFILLAFTHSQGLTYLAAVLLGCGMGVGSPSLNAFMYELSEPEFKGLNANLMMLSLQGGSFLGPILGSAAVGLYGYDGFLLVGAGACLLGLALSQGLGTARPA
ncbi:MFS transporter [Desulfovibrio aerotolerans]|uniref:MFS transporter n=1 Tax=Solidesulfovibrio aerotolerans TaxID=295255 RepID=A0A7C9INJ1_9BACT|nr:MFS transporter [Solidesulfovibrio aerotolerans]MYL83219.1 MFS transporter [Solidesulfovibrio aerotolerans]